MRLKEWFMRLFTKKRPSAIARMKACVLDVRKTRDEIRECAQRRKLVKNGS